LQEVLGSNLAGIPVRRPSKDAPWSLQVLARAHVDIKALKMALYGFFVSAPIGHVLIGALQRAFASRTGTGAKIAQILASNLLIAPIQTVGTYTVSFMPNSNIDLFHPTAFLASMAVINGAKSVDEVIKTVKGGFISVIRVMPVTTLRFEQPTIYNFL
jgi:peroxisomal membrane protein 2